MLSRRHPASPSDREPPRLRKAAPPTPVQQLGSGDDTAPEPVVVEPRPTPSDTDVMRAPFGRARDRLRSAAPASTEPAEPQPPKGQPPKGQPSKGQLTANLQTTSGVPGVPILAPPVIPGGPGSAPRSGVQDGGPQQSVGAGGSSDTAGGPTPTAAGDRRKAALLLLLGGIGGASLAMPAGPVRLLMLLTFLLLGPGGAVLSFVRVPERIVWWALSVTASLTIACGIAVLTLWTHIWQPTVAVAVLVGMVAVTALGQLVAHRRTPVTRTTSSTGPARGEAQNHPPPTGPRRLKLRLRTAAPILLMLGAVVLWAVSVVRYRPSALNGYGLTAALGAPFMAAVLLLCVGLAVELFGRARSAVLVAGLAATVVMLHATVPLMHGTIEFAWTYKHIGVVDLIRDNGHLLDSADIYQQWPGFFATMALLSGVAGVDALAFATWSSLAFAVLNMVLLAALLRQFTASRRVIVLGVLLMQVCMWVDIGYFSPQAFGFTLMIGFWLIATRWLLVVPAVTRQPGGRIARIRGALLHGLPAQAGGDRRSRLLACAAATIVFAAITVSHQLTPFLMLVPAVALTVLGVLRPRLLVVVLTLVVVGFAAPRLSSVAHQYTIFSFDLFSNAAGNADTWRTPEQAFSAVVARSLAIAVWSAALFAIWLARRRLGTVLLPVVLGFAPFVTLAGENYGGEAIYRVYAFSMPFTALLIATMVLRMRRSLLPALATGVVLAIAWVAAIQGAHGQLVVNRVPAADIRAAQYFYAHARPNSSLVLVAPNFPTKLTGNYGSFNRGRPIDIGLVRDPEFIDRLDGSRLTAVQDYIRGLGTQDNYFAVSDQMAVYTDFFGLLPPGATRSLQDALEASPQWDVFYRGPGVTIYQLQREPAGPAPQQTAGPAATVSRTASASPAPAATRTPAAAQSA